MKYRITHTTKYAYLEAVPVCHNLIRLRPRNLPYQSCHQFQLLVHPEPGEISTRKDYFGNHVSYFSIEQPHHGLTISASSDVQVVEQDRMAASKSAPWETIADSFRANVFPKSIDVYQYVPWSKHIQPFAALTRYAARSFRRGRPIVEAVMDLTGRIFRDFKYDPRATTIQTPITEVFEKRHGVCQDFAHLQIGCLRSLGIPARYVSGYLRTIPPPGKPRLVGADASHAWLSAYCGEAGWIDVDPTNDALVSTDHITVAWGRDYNDVSPIQGVIVGGGEHKMQVSVDVAPVSQSETEPSDS